MFCQNCGNKIETGNAFCTSCGATIPQNSKRNSEGTPINGGGIQTKRTQIEDKISKMKIVPLILTACSFLLMFIVPYAVFYEDGRGYRVWLTGGNEYLYYKPGYEGAKNFDISYTCILLFALAALIVLTIFLILEKEGICLLAVLVHGLWHVRGFFLFISVLMNNRNSDTGLPIGCLLQIGLAVALLITIWLANDGIPDIKQKIMKK